jgi:hypothetical protein
MSQITLSGPPGSDYVNLAGSNNWIVTGDSITVNASNVDLKSSACWQLNSNQININACLNGLPVIDQIVNLSTNYWDTKTNFVNLSQNFQNVNNLSNTYLPNRGGSLTGDVTVCTLTEQITSLGSGASLSSDFKTLKSVMYFSPSQNFTLTLSNVPIVQNTTHTLTFFYNQKFYCNNININGNSYSIMVNGGSSNISINTSSTYVMQTITICFFSSNTPVVFSTVSSYL